MGSIESGDEFELIGENKTDSRMKWRASFRQNLKVLMVFTIQMMLILILVSYIVVREIKLTLQNTTTTSPVTSLDASASLNAVCFPCAEIGDNITNNDIGNLIKLDKETNMCCMENAGNLKKLFLLIINEYYRRIVYGSALTRKATGPNHTHSSTEVVGAAADAGGSDNAFEAPSVSKSLSFWKKREDAAHMFIDLERLDSSNETGHRVPWDGHDSHNLPTADHLVKYHPDKRSIQVTDSGLYFIYSSITLKAPTTGKSPETYAQVYHMLLREHYLLPNTGSTIMMMNKHGGGKPSSAFYNSFLCGTFRLRKDDEVFVSVSNASFLYKSYYSNYIGLYKL
ncbi:uncharacterized protein LOC132550557 [Ylistrum balloti]|uniref:uncharacterized protein LOC132550557 n=1 Tax=Ylistrum balloti TaxID=509963 RepID=UPI002905AEF8|nr:uncharacterized protein LOC132550557 [Ylistrum balloti]